MARRRKKEANLFARTAANIVLSNATLSYSLFGADLFCSKYLFPSISFTTFQTVIKESKKEKKRRGKKQNFISRSLTHPTYLLYAKQITKSQRQNCSCRHYHSRQRQDIPPCSQVGKVGYSWFIKRRRKFAYSYSYSFFFFFIFLHVWKTRTPRDRRTNQNCARRRTYYCH